MDLHKRESSRPSSSSLALRMEKQQNLGYQELQKRVSRQYARTQRVLEDWMFEKSNKEFDHAREKLASELLSTGKISSEDTDQLLAKFKTAKNDVQDHSSFSSRLPFPVLSSNELTGIVPNGRTSLIFSSLRKVFNCFNFYR